MAQANIYSAVRELVGELDFGFYHSEKTSPAESTDHLSGTLDDRSDNASRRNDLPAAARKDKFY